MSQADQAPPAALFDREAASSEAKWDPAAAKEDGQVQPFDNSSEATRIIETSQP